MMSERERRIRIQLRDEFPIYAERCLKIRSKDGSIVPLSLNAAQSYLHDRLEEQRKATGKVRALLLKGRQQGISTYIGGRFYHRATHSRGIRVFILTHEQEATNNLFGMVDRYHQHCPLLLKPSTGASNAKELYFDRLESGYAVGTAGAKAVGRSQTVQLFHGCLTPDSFIVTETGALRRMGDYEVGDPVRTHTGAPARISFISRQRKPAHQVTLKGLGQMPLTATAEHRFLTEGGWRALSEISVGDCLLFPVYKITKTHAGWQFRLPDSMRPQGGGSREVGPDMVRPTYSLGRIMGLYLAEGSIGKQSKTGVPSHVTFTVHEREAQRTAEWLTEISPLFRSIKVAPRSGSKTVNVTAYGRSFATFIRALCGELSTKRLPDSWKTCGSEFVRGLIHGYLAGDGHSSRREYDRRISAPSIRSAISVGMRDALAAMGYGWASIGYHPGRLRYGKLCRPIWTLRITGTGVDRLCEELNWPMPERRRTGAFGSVRVADGYAHIPILDIEDIGQVEVMDFEVDHEDHSYCTVHCATHNSEVAFWPNAATHFAGVVQAIPDLPGTEIILESTANGLGGEFHKRWQEAEAGVGDYMAVFIPWFWQPEYRREVPRDFRLDDEEEAYMRQHGLDLEQMVWRRNKIIELADPMLFKQEYPATSAEAFQTTGHDSYIPADLVLRARKLELQEAPSGPLVVGYDPAWKGSDRHCMAFRRGRRVEMIETRMKLDTMEGAGWAKKVIDQARPMRMFIDVGGVGAGVYDRLMEMGYGDVVRAVNFGSSPLEPGSTFDALRGNGGPSNRRAEMWMKSKEWLEFPGGVELPDDDEMQADACAPGYKYDSHTRIVLESKEDLRSRGLRSPDKWDAVALTFAEPVVMLDDTAEYERERRAATRSHTTGY